MGEAFTVQLDQGEVYQVRSEATEGVDLTGSVVQASSPVALFSGHSCANVPTNVSFCDILIEQIPPTDTWGSSFVTRPLEGRENGDTFRILSGQEGTTVEINGESVATLGFGDYYETVLEQPSVIEASNPVLVMQYSNGDEWDPSINANGDPFMMMVPPSEQFSGQYAFSTPNEGFSLNYINLAVPSDATENILVDGSPVESSLFETVGNSEFSVAAKDVELGSHSAESTSDTQFGIYSYGFEDDDSYGFTGGLTLDFISEGSAPNITRTPETIELGEEEIPGGQSITISAEITDPAEPLVQSATVFYRNAEAETYSPVSMSNTEGDIWEGTIPGESVSDPGIEYYISATDGQLTGTSPQVNPSGNPYSFGVLPNKTPTIEHTPISIAPPDEDLTVEASATDENDQVSSVQLFYREAGGNPAYTTLEMQEEGNTYVATIPKGDVTEQGLEYYMRATDSFGVSATEPIGAPDEPIEVSISDDPFADWPDLPDPSITLKVVHPTEVSVSTVKLPVESEEVLKRKQNVLAPTTTITSGRYGSVTKNGQTSSFFTFNSSQIEDAFTGFFDPDDQVYEIRLLNGNEVIGYIPFRYRQSNFEDGVGIEAIVYAHGEDLLKPDLTTDRWSDEWDYYDVPDVSDPYPLSMLVPPEGDIGKVDLGKKEPVLLVHGVSGSYPSWGGISEVRELTRHLDGEGYDGWQFYYPENQNITKSGPLLAKAIDRLQNNLGYGPSQSFDLIAHSMGGLVSRHYVQRMGIGNNRNDYSTVLGFDPGESGEIVDKFLMLGTPNHGSYASFRCTEGRQTRTCDLPVTDKDVGAPAFRQMTPGSRFLDELNHIGEPEENYSPLTTLVLSGERNPKELPLAFDAQEIPNQDDAAVAVSSASLLDIGVPLAVGDFVHSGAFDRDDQYDPRLNEDTKGIIVNFLTDGYDPGSPSDLGDITGFWDEMSGVSADPIPDYENGLSINENEGILTINSEQNETVENISLESCGFLFQDSCLRLRPLNTGPLGEDNVLKVPEQRRFFTYAETDDAWTIGFDQISNGLGAGEQTVKVQTRNWTINGIIEWSDVDVVSVTPKYLQTTQVNLLLDREEEALVAAKAFVPGTALNGANGSTSSKNSQTEEVQYQVDAATDTVTFWATRVRSGDFSGHNMRLVTPDGSVIDSTTAKSESDLGYTQDLDAGSAIYVVEDPVPGRWAVRHDASVSATVSAPVTGTVDLQAFTPDSTFERGETVPVTISTSDQNVYEDADIDAQLQVEDPEGGSPIKLGAIELTQSSPATYEGEFSPSYIGSHQVAVDFSARVDGESVLRRTVESVRVTGDSTETVPEPPPAPSELSVDFSNEDGVTVNWSAPGSGDIGEYRIYRDTIPNPTRQVAIVSSGQTSYTDSEARKGRTYYYRVTAAGAEGVESAYTDASSVFTYPSSLSSDIQRSFGNAESKQDYRLVALPGQASGTLSETVSGNWRGFQENGENGDQPYSRSECDGGCQFGPGEGFWLIAGQSWEVSQTVNTVPLSEAKTTQIDLREGWNIVSNPLDVEVSWSAVQSASGTNQPLWQWDGNWERAQTFAPATGGEAYYFRSDSLSQLTVPYPAPEAVPQTKTDTAESQRQTLVLSAVRGGERLSRVEAGIRPDAKNGLDPYDQFGPPGYFGEATLRLIRETDGRRHALATEYVTPDGDGAVFDLVLHAEPDTTLSLQADGLEAFAEEEAVLVSQSTGKTYELVGDRETPLVPRNEKTRYRLLVGSRSFVEEKKQETTPEDVELLPNYPNPFRARTTIEYALPEAADVRLSVYDVLGRRVAVLEDGRRERGFHRVRWDAGNRSLSSGVYFYRLRAGDETKSRQMVLLR